MAKNVTRAKVEGDPRDDSMALRRMLIAFRNACTDAGIPNSYRQHETFESKSRKKRRKKRESEIARMKQKLRENFNPQGKNK